MEPRCSTPFSGYPCAHRACRGRVRPAHGAGCDRAHGRTSLAYAPFELVLKHTSLADDLLPWVLLLSIPLLLLIGLAVWANRRGAERPSWVTLVGWGLGALSVVGAVLSIVYVIRIGGHPDQGPDPVRLPADPVLEPGYADLDRIAVTVYVVTVACCAAAAIFLIAPVALHRAIFALRRKGELVDVSAKQARTGPPLLGVSIVAPPRLRWTWPCLAGGHW